MTWIKTVLIFLIIIFLYSLYEAYTLRIKHITVSNERIPDGFDGKKIVFISDIHCGAYFSLDRLKSLVTKINALEPDLILIGGDYTTRGVDDIQHYIKIFGGLTAKLGVYSVLGNHDGWGDTEGTISALEGIGVTVLRNKATWIEDGGSRMRVGGVGDLWTDTQDIHPTIENTTADDFIILLSHNPMYIEQIEDENLDLILSGHTHGGQILPVRLIAPHLPSRLRQNYISGEYVLGDKRLIVTNGVGTVFIPIRFFAPPEIMLITLKKE